MVERIHTGEHCSRTAQACPTGKAHAGRDANHANLSGDAGGAPAVVPPVVRPYQREVTRGVAWLDEHHPGWRARIDVDHLALGSCSRCVLGQVFANGYESGYGVVDDEMIGRGIPLRKREAWNRAHGFEALAVPGGMDYDTLQAEWVRVLSQGDQS